MDGEPSGGTGDEGGGDGQDSGGTGGETTPKQTVVTLSPAPRLVNTAPLPGSTVTVPRTLVLTFDHPITVSAGAIEVYGETRDARAGYSITYNDGKRTVRVEWKSPPEGGMSGGANRTVHRWRGQGSFSKGCRDAASEHPRRLTGGARRSGRVRSL